MIQGSVVSTSGPRTCTRYIHQSTLRKFIFVPMGYVSRGADVSGRHTQRDSRSRHPLCRPRDSRARCPGAACTYSMDSGGGGAPAPPHAAPTGKSNRRVVPCTARRNNPGTLARTYVSHCKKTHALELCRAGAGVVCIYACRGAHGGQIKPPDIHFLGVR
ncbi:hypothetical protein DFH11DRAFT_1673667 [Phellopilus nigrolimitatus]|nr:hypothetical protein DFH11DRAFT_1673667 [Phellopilus nigrolimitatus]